MWRSFPTTSSTTPAVFSVFEVGIGRKRPRVLGPGGSHRLKEKKKKIW